MATVSIDFTRPREAQEQLSTALQDLAAADEAPARVVAFADDLCTFLLDLAGDEWPHIDPTLFAELLQAAGLVQRTLRITDPRELAAALELQLERIREILAEVERGVPLDDDRPIVEVATWLKAALQASNEQLHELLGPSTRTWERWLNGDGAPKADDAARIRIAARIVDQLRHALTARGVLRWFERPHPALGGKPPKTLLRDELDAPRLVAIAAQIRRSDAA